MELCSFDGDPLTFFQFVKECVGVTFLNAKAKLTRLLQSCTGRASKALACCNLMNAEDGYIKALDMGKYVSLLALLYPGRKSTFCTHNIINRLCNSVKPVTMNKAT